MSMSLFKNLICICLLLLPLSSYAQFGVSARIQNNSNKAWNNNYQEVSDTSQNLLNRSYEFGINYWFRLKNYRLEFLPEISYASSRTEINQEEFLVNAHTRTSYNFNINIQLYPLDFYGDCNCPTFSKDGNMVAKGFYWLFSPGISHHTLSTEMDPLSSFIPENATATSFRLGIGGGFDMGLTNLITLTPFIQYSMNFGIAWPEQYSAYALANPENDSNRSNINQWHFGIRMIFRPDYKY
ncbi:MAG: hypothetical protein EBS24_02615 [Chitinophagia bacterium]|jgi:hypothetical protein|nr:hypothetical protein [Chitinophagia bacterium]